MGSIIITIETLIHCVTTIDGADMKWDPIQVFVRVVQTMRPRNYQTCEATIKKRVLNDRFFQNSNLGRISRKSKNTQIIDPINDTRVGNNKNLVKSYCSATVFSKACYVRSMNFLLNLSSRVVCQKRAFYVPTSVFFLMVWQIPFAEPMRKNTDVRI